MALLGGARRQLDHADEVALVLLGQEASRQAHEQPGDAEQDGTVYGQPAARPRNHVRDAGLVAADAGAEDAVEEAEEAGGRQQLFARRVLEQRRAHGRRQGQRHEGREDHGQHQRHGELAVDGAYRTAEESHGHEHGAQHQGDADHCGIDLAHGLDGRLAWRQALGGHDPLDVLDHHDRIVHDDADGQHHREQRQHVDREAEGVEAGQRAHQGYRHDDSRDDRDAQVFQEQVHHQEDQDHRLGQRLDHFGNRDLDEAAGVVGNLPGNALGKVLLQFRHASLDGLGDIQGVAVGSNAHGDGGGRLAVDAGEDVVVLGAEFDARDVPDPQRRAVGLGADDDVAEFLWGLQAAAGDDDGIEFLAGGSRHLAQLAGGELDVLGAHGADHVIGRQVVGVQFFRLEPEAHRVFGAEQDGLADALHAPDRVEHVGGGIAAQGHVVVSLVRRVEGDEQQVVALGLGHRHPQAAHVLGQARLDPLVAVLGLHRGGIDVGARFERQRQRARTEFRGCLHVQEMLDAVHLLFD